MEEKEISLKELFSVVWKQKYLLGLIFIAGLVLFGIGGFVYNNSNETMVTYVSLQWDGVADGEYPNGQRFDYTSAVEPAVIQIAIESEGLDISALDVRDAVTLTPVVPGNIESVIATALEAGEQITYFATEFKLTLDYKDLGLSEEEGRSLSEQLIIQFRLDFEKKYVSQSIVLDYTGIDYTDLEYIDIALIIETQIELVDSKMEQGIAMDPNFASTTGITFTDIQVRTELIKIIELNQIKSRTNAYLLSKDAEYLQINYQYQIEVKQLELDKEESKEIDNQYQLDNYNGALTTIIIPGLDQEIDIDPYYDTLLENMIMIQTEIAELENDIAYFELLISRLDGTAVGFDVTPQTQAEEIIKVDGFIEDADIKLGVIVEDANELLVEYNQYLTSNIIKPIMSPVVSSDGLSTILIGIVGGILAAGTATLVVLFKHDWK